MQIKSLIIVVCLIGCSHAAFAQTVPANRDCTPTQSKPNDPNGLNTTDRSDRPLTDKLAESGGVLCPPPAIDDEIRAPAPSTGSNMPVVPPPGSRGGDQSVRPK